MAFDINSFKSNISKRGLLKTNKFKVVFTTPSGLASASSRSIESPNSWSTDAINPASIAYDMQFYCDSVNMPGVNVLTSENRRYGIGSPQKNPIGVIFNDINLSIMADAHGENVRFFQNWIKLVNNYDVRKGYRTNTGISGGINEEGLSSEHYPHEINYKYTNNGSYVYATDLQIYVYDDTGDEKSEPKETLLYTVREAFPILLGDIPLNWSDTNNIARIPVTFAYFDWYEKYLTQ